ncbi:hypothetical protein ACNOYE_28895 [Nannocystaceae bacterium ST9]
MSADSTDATPSPEAVARRLAAHERELLARRRWGRAVTITSLSLLTSYVCLLFVVRVTEPVYLIVNLLAMMTGLCGFIVHLAYELPTILAELPRLSDRERRVNLKAIESTRAELLGRVLPSLGLTRSREEAAAIDDDELVRRLAELRRPDWRRIAPYCFVAWLVVVSTTLALIATYRPEFGVSLIDRMKGREPAIDQRWAPNF